MKIKSRKAPAHQGRKSAGGAKAQQSLFGPTVEERIAIGKAIRKKVSRTSQGKWEPAKNRENPVELLRRTNEGRIHDLLPIRYGRMRQSPFAFFRGAAAIMAADLATTPATGLRAQLCGDAHLMNFGGYGSPGRGSGFAIYDFDEAVTAPGGWVFKA